MFQNYLVLALRNLYKSPSTSLINLGGLAIGMLCALLILVFVHKERAFDRFHQKSDRLFRVLTIDEALGVSSSLVGVTLPPLGPAMETEVADVRKSVRIAYNGHSLIDYARKPVYAERSLYSENALFQLFDYELVAGNRETVLSAPNTAVLTQAFAQKLFGAEDPMGKIIRMDNDQELEVAGIMKDLVQPSHMAFDVLVSLATAEADSGFYQMMRSWGTIAVTTYVELSSADREQDVEAAMEAIIRKNNVGDNFSVTLQPFEAVHLHSGNILFDEYNFGKTEAGYLYTLSIVGLFVVLIAAFNFMNLSTARSSKRAMEVGLRKVMGADKQLLIRQFMGESIFMTTVSLVLAILLVYLVLPIFSDFTDKELSLDFLENPSYLFWMILMVVVVGMISGSYPALFLSGFQPVRVMKGTYKIGSAHEKFRSVLVVGQFAISIILIVCVIVVINQLDYMKSKDLGFEKEDVAVLPAYSQLTDNYEIMRTRLLQHPGITEVSLASRIPSGRLLDSQGTKAEVNGELSPLNIRIADVHVSHTFVETFGMQLMAGRNFDLNLASDSTQAFILNETAVRAVGWSSPEEALDKQVEYGNRRGYVVGVLKDFHFESLHQPIVPIIFMVPDDRFSRVTLKIDSDQREEVLAYLEQEWIAMRPDSPVDFTFIEDQFIKQYEAEERIGTIFGFFAMLAVFISVLGLFGLTAYATEQRTKEIGIRKVMGASVFNIVTLLGKDFLKLVLVGFVISIPIAWYGMDQWLGNFAYSITVTWVVFLIAGLTACIIAIVTVSSQSIRAALINPVDTFKVE